MVPAGNKAKRHSSLNHIAKKIHHHQHQFPVIKTSASSVKCVSETLLFVGNQQ